MIKTQSFYRHPDGRSFRLRSPQHFGDFLESQKPIDTIGAVVAKYVLLYPGRVQEVDEDGGPL